MSTITQKSLCPSQIQTTTFESFLSTFSCFDIYEPSTVTTQRPNREAKELWVQSAVTGQGEEVGETRRGGVG